LIDRIREVVLVLDAGTSSLKGALYTRTGERLAMACAAYPLHTPEPHFVEQDPADYLRAAQEVSRQLTAVSNIHIHAVGFSTQTPTLVFCDADGEAVCPAIVWQDSRAGAQAAEMLATYDAAVREEWFGMDLPIAAATTPPKLLWMRDHRPDAWQRTRYVVQPKDYLAAKLTGGEWAADRWCAKGLANLDTGHMHPEWLALLGRKESICPPVRSMRDVIGCAVTNDWGIPADTPVMTGWSDALAAILATGALDQHEVGFVLTGTSEIIGASRREPRAQKGLFLVPPDVLESSAGVYLHYGPTQAGGSSLQWISRLLGKPVEDSIPAETKLSSIVCRPWWQGERAPYWDHTLTASFDGLREQHTAADVVLAVLQGVALQERVVLERAGWGATIKSITLAGGAARNATWNQIRANIHQTPIHVLRDTEASLRGAAIVAWNLRDTDGWLDADTILPDASQAEEAEQLMQRFRL